jgi:hypothetical protein
MSDPKIEQEGIEPCPFCGAQCVLVSKFRHMPYDTDRVICPDFGGCGYGGRLSRTSAEAISAHNRLARSARAVEKIVDLCEENIMLYTAQCDEFTACGDEMNLSLSTIMLATYKEIHTLATHEH